MSWTTVVDLRARLERLWQRGELLADRTPFPWTFALRRPDAKTLSERFDEVRAWVRDLDRERGAVEIEWIEINHRVHGANRLPTALVVRTEADALELIGKTRDAARFRTLHAMTRDRLPRLESWLTRRPMEVVEHEAIWERVLAVLEWFVAHPRSGVYLRQIDIGGVDTKFVESNRALFVELLDEVLPADALVADAIGAQEFERRYGLRSKPRLVRFRMLDERRKIAGLSELAVPVDQLRELEAPARRVFITENEINGLAFPPVEDALVIFGLGYGTERLAEVPWLRDRTVHYWGDLDTHGFAILDRLRASLGDVRSLLMDRETLLHHRAMWVEERDPVRRSLTKLDSQERALYDDLVHDRLGVRVRLEQERIAYGRLLAALSTL